AQFNLDLSKVAHREETIFTHEIKRAGYTLLVCGDARVYHFRQPSGGIRSDPSPTLYEDDDRIFRRLVQSWNYKEAEGEKVVVLNNGLGDHYAFLHVLDTLKDKKVRIAACYPDVFFEHSVDLISIAEAELLLGDLSRYDIYKWMDAHN